MLETLRLKLALFILPKQYESLPIRTRMRVRALGEDVRHVAVDHLRAGSHIRKRFTKLADELVKVIGASGTVSW